MKTRDGSLEPQGICNNSASDLTGGARHLSRFEGPERHACFRLRLFLARVEFLPQPIADEIK